MIEFKLEKNDLETIFKMIEEKYPLVKVQIEEIGIKKGRSKIDQWSTQIPKVWTQIKRWVLIIESEGKSAYNRVIDEIDNEIDTLKEKLGEQYTKVQNQLIKRILELQKQTYKRILQVFPHTLEKDNLKFSPKNVELVFEIKAASDLKVSITEYINFMVEGKVIVKVDYECKT